MDPWDYLGWALLCLVMFVASVYVLIFVALAAALIQEWRDARRQKREKLKQDDVQPNTYTRTKYERAWDAWYGQAWKQSRWQKGSDG